MIVVNPKFTDDLAAGRPIKLNLGVGDRAIEGHYGIDLIALPTADVVGDLTEVVASLPDNSVSAVVSRHVLEHIPDLLGLIKQLHRVLVPGGTMDMIVPHFSNPYGYSDPTHVRFFGLYSFFYFVDEAEQPRRKVPAHYLPERLIVDEVTVTLVPTLWLPKPVRRLMTKWVNRSIAALDRFERSWCRIFPIDSMRYKLRVKKGPSTTH